MHISWSEVELFLAISEAGSLSAAAKRLKTTQPTVSRRLAELESALREPLFVRSIDGTTPTSFGERMLPAARRMAEAAVEVQRAASGAAATPKGIVRVSASPGVAFTFLAPFAARLRAALPEVCLEVVATTTYVDLVRREADLALRTQSLGRAPVRRDLLTLATATSPVAAFAAPSVLAGLPPSPRLLDVPWIAWAPPFEDLPPTPQLSQLIPDFRPVFAATDYIVQIRAAEAGVGAVLLERLGERPPSAALVELPVSFGKLSSTLHLVGTRSALAIPRVKAVADLLAKELTAHSKSATPKSGRR